MFFGPSSSFSGILLGTWKVWRAKGERNKESPENPLLFFPFSSCYILLDCVSSLTAKENWWGWKKIFSPFFLLHKRKPFLPPRSFPCGNEELPRNYWMKLETFEITFSYYYKKKLLRNFFWAQTVSKVENILHNKCSVKSFCPFSFCGQIVVNGIKITFDAPSIFGFLHLLQGVPESFLFARKDSGTPCKTKSLTFVSREKEEDELSILTQNSINTFHFFLNSILYIYIGKFKENCLTKTPLLYTMI